MNILVTGATGFIGSHLVETLVETTDYKVSILKRRNSRNPFKKENLDKISTCLLNEDGSNIDEIIKQEMPDVVIHLASLFLSSHTKEQIDPLIQSNIIFPTKLLEAMAEHKVSRLINTGTLWEHFNGFDTYDPVNLYAATKKSFEDILKFYVEAKDLTAVTIKFYDTYGPRDDRPKLFALLKRCLKDNDKIDFSPGEQSLDLLYVDDVTDAYIKTLDYIQTKQMHHHETIAIGSGNSIKLKDVIAAFEETAGGKLNIHWGGRPYRAREVMHAKADISDAKKKLGWSPQVTLNDGLKRMLEGES